MNIKRRKCAAAAGVNASAEFSQPIPSEALHRSNENIAALYGLCVGASSHELFLADGIICWGGNNVVRTFDVGAAQVDARDAFRCPEGEKVNDVAYIAESDNCSWPRYTRTNLVLLCDRCRAQTLTASGL